MIRIYYKKVNGDCSDGQSLAMYRCLPVERREKIEKLKNKALKSKHIQIGFFLQEVLSKETGISKELIRYIYGEKGKPELDYEAMEKCGKQYINIEESPHICFNMSHSGDYVVVGVSDGALGIDIEHKTRNYLSIAKRCFHRQEYEEIVSHEQEEEQRRRFLEIWTMKEAYIKWDGKGMEIPLGSFLVTDKQLHCHVVDTSDYISPDYIVSVCGSSLEDVENDAIFSRIPVEFCSDDFTRL